MNGVNFKLIDALLLATDGFTGTIDTDFIHSKSAANSTDHFYAELAKAGIPENDIPSSLEEAFVSAEHEYERQGFISGFRMGAQLMLECIGPAPLEAWNPNNVGKPGSQK